MLDLLLRNSTIEWYTDGLQTSEGIGAGVARPGTKPTLPSYPSAQHLGQKWEAGNELADELDCSSAASRMIRPEFCIAVGFHIIK